MISVFGNYAHYYDLLYKDKDYAAEGEYVHQLIQNYAPGAKSVLELGCGTGKHAQILSTKGYTIHGVDRSPEMLESASKRISSSAGAMTTPSFSLGDIRNVRIDDKFDVVISLFHVMSYQTTDYDLMASFATAKFHLKPGGIFIFDCWYGPAVLSQKPEKRVKHFENEQIIITRTAEPVMHPAENVIDVNYHVIIRDKTNNEVEELHEAHRMRYLFEPEINSFLAEQGLKLFDSFAWMSGKKPDTNAWGVCFVAQA